MKKVKFEKIGKRYKKRKVNKFSKNKIIKKKKTLTIFKFITTIIILFFNLILLKENKREIEINEINENFDNNTIWYKGNKINRDKLIAEYFSQVHGAGEIEEETNFLKKTFFWPIYNEKNKDYYKNLFLKKFSKEKKEL